MINDLVAVIQSAAIVDEQSDLLVVDVFIEGPPDQDRSDWIALVRDHLVPIPRRANDSEIQEAVSALLAELEAQRDGTDRQRVTLDSPLVGQDIRVS